MKYYIHRGGRRLGPYTPEQVVSLLRAHQLALEDLCVEEGAEDWQPLGNIVDPALLAPTLQPAPISGIKMPPDPNTVHLQEDGMTVTNSRFIVGTQTFAVSNISAVKMKCINPAAGWPLALVCIGAAPFLIGLIMIALEKSTGDGVGLGMVVLGVAIASAGLIAWRLAKASYCVILTTAGGESRPYSNPDRETVVRVVTAINHAIIARS
jgi:hypothetical protein